MDIYKKESRQGVEWPPGFAWDLIYFESELYPDIVSTPPQLLELFWRPEAFRVWVLSSRSRSLRVCLWGLPLPLVLVRVFVSWSTMKQAVPATESCCHKLCHAFLNMMDYTHLKVQDKVSLCSLGLFLSIIRKVTNRRSSCFSVKFHVITYPSITG